MCTLFQRLPVVNEREVRVCCMAKMSLHRLELISVTEAHGKVTRCCNFSSYRCKSMPGYPRFCQVSLGLLLDHFVGEAL